MTPTNRVVANISRRWSQSLTYDISKLPASRKKTDNRYPGTGTPRGHKKERISAMRGGKRCGEYEYGGTRWRTDKGDAKSVRNGRPI